MFLALFCTLVCIGLASRIYKFLLALQEVNNVPGLRVLFSPMSALGNALPKSSINQGVGWPWDARETAFFGHTFDVITVVPILQGRPVYYTSSLEVVRQLLGNEGKVQLFKPLEITLAGLWGDSIASSSGDIWRRHRRIVSPSFNPKTYSMVWAETIATYKEMTEAESWENENVVSLSDANVIVNRFTLVIMSRCGFGLPMSWATPIKSNDSDLTFEQALTTVSETLIARLLIPRWAYKLPIKKLHAIDQAWVKVAEYMHHFSEERKQDLKDATNLDATPEDIFTRLVAASDGIGKYALEERELVANMFSLLFAGHETTAGGLVATLGYLAIYQDEQEKAYAEIEKAVPHGRDPAFDDAINLPHLLACFQEAQRLIPGALMLPRDMMEDTPIKVTHPAEKTIVLKKGSRMIFELVSIHRNPRFFPEPHKFRPSRWYGVSEHDVSMFGMGPRACIGRKFAQSEVLCFLCLLLREWKIDVVLRDGETVEEYEHRVMGNASMTGTAFRLASPSLRLTRRQAVA